MRVQLTLGEGAGQREGCGQGGKEEEQGGEGGGV